jgi:hypothetical protein
MGVQLTQAISNVSSDPDFRQLLVVRDRDVKPAWASMSHDEGDGGRMTLDASPPAVCQTMTQGASAEAQREVARNQTQLIAAICPIGAMAHICQVFLRDVISFEESSLRLGQW